MPQIVKPLLADLEQIRRIMSFWTEKKEVIKYLERIDNEINQKTEYNLQFWIAKEDNRVVGIIGMCNPLPKILPLAISNHPGEIKILYVDHLLRGQGIGKQLVQFIEKEAAKQGYSELMIRSAHKYQETAYGFYLKMGYRVAGTVSGGDESKTMQVFQKQLQ